MNAPQGRGDRPAERSAAPALRSVNPAQRSAFWWNVSKYSVLAFCRVYFRLRVEGRHLVPKSGPVLLVANHASYTDPPLVGITTDRWVAFLAQMGLAKTGFMRWWLAQMGVTLIDRNAPSKDAMRTLADCLANGEAVGVFPEGTRSPDGGVGPFRNGVEFLVRRTGAVVVPIGIEGAHRAFPRGALLPRPRKLVIRYGEPWAAERVLAPGGTEALRSCVAELARAPLRSAAEVGPDQVRSDAVRSDTDPKPPARPTVDSRPSAGSGA